MTMDLDHLANRKPKRIGNPNMAKVKPNKVRAGLIDTMRPLPNGLGLVRLIKADQAEALGIKRKKFKKVVD